MRFWAQTALTLLAAFSASVATAQQMVINELYRGGNLTTTDEWVELVLQQDLTAAQLESFFIGDSSSSPSTTASKFGAFRLQNMSGIAATFKAGTIIVLAGQTGPAEDLSYDPVASDFNLIFRTNNVRVVTVTANADFAGDDVAWVDTSSTGSTIAAGVGFCLTWDGNPAPGALGAACGLTLPFNTNNTGARLDQDFSGIVAGDWSVGVSLASLTPGQANGGANTLAIQALRSPTTISVNDVTLAEGNSGTSSMSFTVTLNAASAQTVTVNFNTADGTATAGSDYTNASGTVTFPAGTTTQLITVDITGDATVESDETVLVNLTNPSNATIVDNQGVGTIQNDDVAVATATVSVDSISATETNVNSDTNFTLTRSNNTTAFSVLVSTNAITAQTGTDFTVNGNNAAFTVNFAAGGSLTQTVPVSIIGDTLVEPTETFGITIGALNNASGTTTIANADGTGTILDDDTLLSVQNLSAAEGNIGNTAINVSLTRTGVSSVPHTVTLSSLDGGATLANSDYIAVNQEVTFAVGETSKTVPVTLVGDRFWESPEAFSLRLSDPSGNAQIGPNAQVLIANDDAPAIRINDVTVLEGDANSVSAVLTVTAVDDLAPPQPGRSLQATSGLQTALGSSTFVELNYSTANGSATAGSDYSSATSTVSLDVNQRTATITIPVLGDTTIEPSENFLVNLTLAPGNPARIDDGQGQITITDNDTSVSLLAAPTTLLHGQAVTLTATVRCGVTPTGSVSFANGATSLGTANLVAGAPGEAVASLDLPLLNAGSYTVTASYTGVTPCVSANGSAVAVQVNPAATTLSLTGPASGDSRRDQSAQFNFVLAVTAPGGGIPTGTVTISDGTNSCNAPASASGNCTIAFPARAVRNLTASFAASNGNHLTSTSGSVAHSVFTLADISISKSDGVSNLVAGDLLNYAITVRNDGPDEMSGLRVLDTPPLSLLNVSWTCVAQLGAVCPLAAGTSTIDALVQTMPSGARLLYTLSGTVATPAPLSLSNTASVQLPTDPLQRDIDTDDLSSTDINNRDLILRDGFENPVLVKSLTTQGELRIAPTSSGAVPQLLERFTSSTGAEILRVYGRSISGQAQLALAERGLDGRWTLSAFRSVSEQVALIWQSDATGELWVELVDLP